MKLGFIIQARTQSTRLPEKVIRPFYKDKSILDIIIANLNSAFPSIPKILASSINPKDKILEMTANKWHIDFFCGEETDVLKRFIDAAKYFSLNRIIRICSDNPFLDMEYMQLLIEEDAAESNCDYIGFRIGNMPSIKTHYGFWSEYVTLNALERTANLTNRQLYHEHVTNFIYENPKKFKIKWIALAEIFAANNLRFTVDNIEDFRLLQDIYQEIIEIKTDLRIKDIIDLVLSNPEYMEIMTSQIEKYRK